MGDLIKLSTAEGRSIRILERSALQYRDIGTILLKDETGAVVQAIQETARDNPVVAARMIYERWIQEDEDHSWKKLAKCFRDVQLNPLARDIEQHFGLPSPSDQSMFTAHAKLHATEHILILTAGAQAQPSHQEVKENLHEKDAGMNCLKMIFIFNSSLKRRGTETIGFTKKKIHQ